jgi:hypothetical protein
MPVPAAAQIRRRARARDDRDRQGHGGRSLDPKSESRSGLTEGGGRLQKLELSW